MVTQTTNPISVELLTPADEGEYTALLESNKQSLLYVSLRYRRLLRQHVGGEDRYLVAKQDNRLVGALPLFLFRNEHYGNVMNSLPFYGSNGGINLLPDFADDRNVIKALIGELHELAKQEAVVATTIIASPFECHQDLYERYLPLCFQDSRLGQVSALPSQEKDPEELLMGLIHKTKRTDVRKARKSGVTFRHTDESAALRFLAQTHQKNMEAIGGLAKDWHFFRTIPEVFRYDKDYRLYLAELNGQPVSGLLVFYFNKTAEYFTPATVKEYKNLQPNSLLIFEAMKDAISRGLLYWNFGGTWHSQMGVYNFKRRWGAQEMPYIYYTAGFMDMGHFLALKPDEIFNEYPFFYVLPFSKLKGSKNDG